MPLSRFEAFARIGRIETAETLFARASDAANDAEWRGRLERSPHGEVWHASFHISEFPAGDPRACMRKPLYEMMGLPLQEPPSRMLMGTAIAGQAFEDWNLRNLMADGRLLSAPPEAPHQTRFGDADHWMTGSPDFIVLPPFWNRPHLIETKTKDAEIVAQMKALTRSYDAVHARQCRGYIGVGNRISPLLWPKAVVCRDTWRLAYIEPNKDGSIDAASYCCRDHGQPLEPGTCLVEIDLEPLRTGSLIYGGRDRPHLTNEYVFEHDEAWFQSGLDVVAKQRAYFERDEIPPHPFGGKEWSELPCKWCRQKKYACKPDQKNGTTKLSESAGIKWARELYGSYDADEVRQAVLDRWAGRSGVYGKTMMDKLVIDTSNTNQEEGCPA